MIEGTINYPPYTIAWANTQGRIFRSFPFQTPEMALAWAKEKATTHLNIHNQPVYMITPDHQFKPVTAQQLGIPKPSNEHEDDWNDEDEDEMMETDI